MNVMASGNGNRTTGRVRTPARRRAGARRVVRLALALGGVLSCIACLSERITSSRSGVMLIIDRITAPDMHGGERSGSFLQSDVVTHGSVSDDVARVTTRLAFRDPGTTSNPAAPTSANFVTVDRYRVRYIRSDGRNIPGNDVPHAWDGAATFTTAAGTESSDVVLVRASAKLASPLIALRNGGGEVIIDAIAEITFFGHDQTGAPIAASGRMTVHFADWADRPP